ncbi:hypothetical protein [Oceanobacillus sp. Castelsardo]|uniref:hypothetical protein n=1 Tax=Oceanobacillus sp. Castelsardo TaxID=1851204 RepID=UPI000839810D|nr:hypothetical protein [Oceanobacillus sp. Castelsardo]
MVKNLPFLLIILVVGCSTLTIALTTSLPQFIEVFLLIVSAVLNIWSMLGLIVHVGIQKLNRGFSK